MGNWRPIVKMPGTSLSASKRVVGPRQAGLLAPDHCRWAPSQGMRLGGSRPRLLGYSDGFAPDSHRLPFFSSPRATYRSFLTCRAWPASPPPKGERNYRMRGLAKSGDARLLEVRFQLFDGWHAVDFIRLDVHELFLGGEDELDQVGDFDVRRIRNTKREQLHNDVGPDFGAVGQVHLFQSPEDAVQRVKAELALGLLGAGRDYSQRRALSLGLDRFVHSQAGSSDACWVLLISAHGTSRLPPAASNFR